MVRPLGDLIRTAKVLRAGTADYPLLSMTMHNGLVRQSSKFKKRVASSDVSQYKVVRRGQLVVGFPIDEGVLDFQTAYDRAIVSPAYAVWDVDSTPVHAPYLKRFLRSKSAMDYYSAKLRGSTARRRSLPSEVFLALEVPLPAPDEQRRIAAILDQADALHAKRRQVLAHLGALTQSLFYDLVGEDWWRAVTVGPRTNRSRGYRWVPLTDISRLATGHTPDRKRSDYWNGDIPWISLPDIRRLDGRDAVLTDLRVTALGLQNSSAVLLPAGTVTFSRTASVGFVTKMASPMATSQDFHNWVPSPAINGDYLMSALRFSRAHLLGASDGSIHRTIYQRVAERFHVLLPPISVQEHFARQVASVNVWRSVAEQTLLAVDDLFASLQSRAFGGEL